MSSEDDKKHVNMLAGFGIKPPPPPPPNTDRLGLRGYFARPEVRGLYYNGQKLVLDGYTFIGCRFDNCRLEVSSTNFDLIQCVIDSSTMISYGEEPAKIIKLFNGRFDWAYEHWPDFVPIRNLDGSITISSKRI